jgi:lipoprotein signal peptidase
MHAIKYSINAGASIAAHDDYTFIKAEFMPILLAKYILFYFMNKCDGLAEITVGLIFTGGLKVVKSLTIVATSV